MSLSAITPPRPVEGGGFVWIDTHNWDRYEHPSWVSLSGGGEGPPEVITINEAVELTKDLQLVVADTADALAWIRRMGDHKRANAMYDEIEEAGYIGLIGWALEVEYSGNPIAPLENENE